MQRSNKNRFIALLLLWLSASILYMNQYSHRLMIGTLSNEISSSLNISVAQVNNLITFFIYAYLISVLLTIPLVNKIGRIKLLLMALTLDQIGIFFLYFANQFQHVAIALMLLGFSGACAISLALAFVKEMMLKRGSAVYTAATFLSGIFGVFIGTVIIRTIDKLYDWHETILFLSIFDCLALACFFMGNKLYGVQFKTSSAIETNENNNQISPFKTWRYWGGDLYVSFLMMPSIAFVIAWLVPFTRTVMINHPNLALISPDMVFIGFAIGFFLYPNLIKFEVDKKVLMVFASGMGAISSVILLFLPVPITHYNIVLVLLGISLSGYMVATTYIQQNTPLNAISKAMPLHIVSINLLGVIVLNIIDYWVDKDLNNFHYTANLTYHLVLGAIPISFSIATLIALTLPSDKSLAQLKQIKN